MRARRLVQVVVVAGLFCLGPKVWADDTAQLKDQVQALQQRVDQLEGELANKQQASPQVTANPVYGYSDQWEDPIAQMMLIRNQMDRAMRQAFVDTGMYSPKVDMKQTDDHYIITMDVPGMDKDKINVEVKQGMLVISGERQSETEDNKNNQYYRQERSFGSFMQAIPLPEDALTDKIEARYKNGVLKVTIERKKKEEKRSGSEKIMVK